jgi:hypothetical protein
MARCIVLIHRADRGVLPYAFLRVLFRHSVTDRTDDDTRIARPRDDDALTVTMRARRERHSGTVTVAGLLGLLVAGLLAGRPILADAARGAV